MATLIQSIGQLIDNVTVTDRQEKNIQQSLTNLEGFLRSEKNNLGITRIFTNGSYERDTNIRPLDDIDLFVVLKLELWKNEVGQLPNPQSVLTKIKSYLDGINDYQNKVKQDRPCVTVELSNKSFDILPCFEQSYGGYLIPNYDLKSWTYSYPEKLTSDLESINKTRNYKVKPTIKAIKYWNRENNKLIPSYHIEEVAITVLSLNNFSNYEEAIRLWFNKAEHYLDSTKFKSIEDHAAAINKIKKVKDKLNDAKRKNDAGSVGEALKTWKEIFGKEFPTIDVEEAKNFSKALTEGTLKISSKGTLSTTVGMAVGASKGFHHDVSKD